MVTCHRTLSEIQLSEQNTPGRFKLRHDSCVEIGDKIAQYFQAAHRRHAFRVTEVLHRDRNSVQRSPVAAGLNLSFCSPCGSQCMVPHHRRIAVQTDIERVDSVKHHLREFDRRDFSRFNQPGDFSQAQVVQWSAIHVVRWSWRRRG